VELTFQNFQAEYQTYREIENHFLERRINSTAGLLMATHLSTLVHEFQNLDVKMRLAFGISEIRLNNEFVSDKEGDLKLCHLLYYKLADLWFAYETYLKLFEIVTGTGKLKIVWLDGATHHAYAISPTIIAALASVNAAFATTYNSTNKRNQLIEYLEYCEKQAVSSQRQRLAEIIAKMKQAPVALTHSETLTIIYAVRNNFVHSGETTVVPNIFGYRNKSKLLKILYQYLTLVLLNATNITCRRI
jgi:hypothetical protein